MPFALQVPGEYGYVLTVAASTFFIALYHGVNVSLARKAAGVKYPTLYASEELAAKDAKAFRFNCAQRAHGNFLENYTPFLGALLISGLRLPVQSAILGAIWCFGRLWYMNGYTNSGPTGRTKGYFIASIAGLVLNCMSAWTAVKMVMESA